MSYPTVLHPDVVEFLRHNTQNQFREQVWKCLQKLKKGQFDGGLRVKKLKGITKGVWEARITEASRLIFTYQHSLQPEKDLRQTYIAIQDICIDHDDVSRSAEKAKKRTADAECLDTDVIKEIGSLEQDRASLSTAEQEELDKAEAEELQFPTEVADELLGNIQWRVLETEKEWQQAIINQDTDLPLKLTPTEYELATLPGNLLLSGCAGTGKTTVALYRLINSLEYFPTGKRLYVAHNSILVKEAYKQFKNLVGTKISDIEYFFHFKTIRDLCIEIFESSEQIYIAYDEVNYQDFEQLYRRSERQKYPPALVWDEIRSIVKGSQLATDTKLLSKKEYERLGNKRSSVIPANERHIIYRLAEWYQRRIEEDGRFDEIDLAREVLKLTKQGKGNRYDLIVCDEVQDFTELQLELLVQLITSEGHLLFTGDLNQMISPSGFRWEDLKTKFFKGKRQAIQKSLGYNFRSVGSLVNLANQLLKLRSRLLKERLDNVDKPVKNYGEPARLIAASVDKLQPTLQQLNPEDAILVRTDVDKERLSREFQSSLVFTIEEAKGLEFDTVFLVEFFKPSQSLWNQALSIQRGLREKDIPQFRLELNLLYVAVTRARRILNIWESKISNFWNQAELTFVLQLIEADLVRDNQVEATSQMWYDRGLYYQEAGFYRQALECFEKSGNINLQWKVKAKLLLQENKYSEAAQIFFQLENWQQAAQLFEKVKQWQEAADCWRRYGNIKNQHFCEIVVLENAQEWELAAQKWEIIEHLEDAKRCWLKSSNNFKKAEIRAVEFEHEGQWLKAVEQYELLGSKEKAAECRAREFEKRKQWKQAYEEYKLAGMNDKAESIREIFDVRAIIKNKQKKNSGLVGINNKSTPLAFLGMALGDSYLLDSMGGRTSVLEITVNMFNDYIDANPNDAKAYNNRGIAFLYLKYFQEAIEDFTQAIIVAPHFEIAYQNRGYARYCLGDNKGAMEDYAQAIRINPKNDTWYEYLGGTRYKILNECITIDFQSEVCRHIAARKESIKSDSSVVTKTDFNHPPLEVEIISNKLEVISPNKNVIFSEMTLPKLLLLPTDKAFRWMGITLENHHTLTSFAQDINQWYYGGVQNRVSQAVEYKRIKAFDDALAIYSTLFQEMPTWSPLYSSVYKLLASAGRIDEAERAIQLNALLVSFDYTLRKPAIVWDTSLNLQELSDQNERFGVLAFWPFQDMTLLLHLGAITMLKEGSMDRIARKGYLNSIQGQGSVMGCISEDVLQNEGRKVLMMLPWKAISNSNNSNAIVEEVINRIRDNIF